MEKVLMHFNQGAYQGSLDRCNQTALPLMQQIVDKFHELNVGKLPGDQLPALFADPKSFVFDKMQKGQEVKLFGITVKKEKAMEMLDMPPALEEVQQLISFWQKEQLNRLAGENFFDVSYFDLREETVIISELFKEQLKKSNSTFAETEKEQAIFKTFSQVADLLDNLQGQLGKQDMKKLFDLCILQEGGAFKNGRVVINARGIKGSQSAAYSHYS